MSLRLRLTIWVIVLFVVVQVITTGVFWLYQHQARSDLFDAQLQARAASIASQVADNLPSLTDEQLQLIADHESRYMRFASFRVMIVGADDSNWTRSPLDWPNETYSMSREARSRGQPRFRTMKLDWFMNDSNRVPSARLVALPIRGRLGNPYVLVVATSDEYVRSQSGLAARIFLAAGLVGLIAAAIAGWFIAGLAVEPLNRVKDLASQLGPTSVAKHFEPGGSSAEVIQLTQALDAARERIREAFAAQERFLSHVSHEIKTPIATLLIEAQTMDRERLPAPAAQFVRLTEEEMRRLGKLVESFLTLTRIQDGKGMAAISRVPVNELVLDSVAHCTSMARQYYVTLRPSLVEDDEYLDAAVAGDPDLLRTMLDNLIRNAIRFSPQDASVRIHARIENDTLHVAVRDEGPGLPPQLLANIFDRFVQAPEEQRRGRGHGLGLTIAQAVAELHGGRIRVNNIPEGGAEFVAMVPLARPPQSPGDGPSQAASEAPSVDPGCKPSTV